jgi:hypothetical protein
MRKKIITFIIVITNLTGCYQFSTDVNTIDANAKTDTVDKAVDNSALQVFQLDVSAVSEISAKLEKSCYRNKFGLSEEACIQVVRIRKNICMQEAAQKYSAKISNTERMRETTSSYVNCLFKKQEKS